MHPPAPRAENKRPSRTPAPGRKCGEAETQCLECARRLHQTLEQEAQALKRFAGPDLLSLIANKEFQVGELGRELERLKGGGEKITLSGRLRDLLASIDGLNRSNRLFVQSSLEYCGELLSLLHPAGYGPGAEAQRGAMAAPKGLSFSREV